MRLKWLAVIVTCSFLFLNCVATAESTMELPKSLSVISEEAFENCKAIYRVVIPSTVSAIMSKAFYGCENLKEVLIPESVSYIDDSAFDGCSNLTVKLFSGSYADTWARNLSGLKIAYINNEVYGNGDYLYSRTSSNTITILKYEGEETGELIVPSQIDGYTVTKLAQKSFEKCQASSIVLPDSLLEIGYEAFYYSREATQIILPESLITIDSEAFLGCGSLQSIHIPAATVNLGSGLFRGCRALTEMTVAEGNSNYEMYKGALIRKENMELITMPFGLIDNTLSIPDGIRIIGNTAFGYEGPYISNLIIPDSVEEIRSSAFVFSSVQHIEIGSGVKVMGSPFSYCGALKTVVIKEGTTVIGSRAFDNCSKLEKVTIPDSVVSIGDGAFYNDLYVSFIANDNSYAAQYAEEHGIGKNKRFGDYLYELNNNEVTIIKYDGDETGELIVPSQIDGYTVTKLAQNSFEDCQASSIVLPDSLFEIGYEAFYYSSKATQIILPESLITIDSEAFLGCGSLQSIHIPAATVNLGSGLFRGCRALTEMTVAEGNSNYEMYKGALIRKENMELITMPFGLIDNTLSIPDGIKIIGYTAFGYEGPYISNLIIPDSVEEIRSSAFAFSSVQRVEIGSGVKLMESPFSYCSSLKTVVIKEGTTIIGSRAFNNCPSLESVTIPNSVERIGYDAFYNDLHVTFIADDNSYAAQYAEENGISRISPQVDTD